MEEVMRLQFHNIDQAKRIAKQIARHTVRKLSECQGALARVAGYRDWHDLLSATPSEAPRWIDALALSDQANVIVSLADKLNSETGLVQFALSETSAFGLKVDKISHQLELRALCFRNTSIPELGPRQPGSVGYCKPWREPVIFKKHHRAVECISNKHWDSLIADFEYSTPKEKISLFIPRRLYLLYGMYIQHDGSRILYSRDYEPMWRLREGQRPERFRGPEYIEHVDRIGFWDDSSTPWRNEARYIEELDRLKFYGIAGLPFQVERLSEMVRGTFRSPARLRPGLPSR